ncbi:hypothetical protein [Levilactobacillus acidifarinae]|uniref:Uncharacterized protein n=1 Tax=Levilactobacillus acidifarinae DSM 19394 = JCM 15949 TaxID=1423715 RepID=A0A0R1LLA5_9LACO|nr:hypothetical protein [Levilactobacillus acidifarinae]KRK96669.1 hypothetical protein FD25_GL001747 [Levilactobacillus acidifarinae DSM 19394]GEO70365.1 hypothetical protein LAC03_22750 [Levilactobacillus acidifarinae]
MMNGLTPEQQAALRDDKPQSRRLGETWVAAALAAVDDLIDRGTVNSETVDGDSLKGEIIKSIDCQEVAAMQAKGTIPAESKLSAASHMKAVSSSVRATATIKHAVVTINRNSLS